MAVAQTPQVGSLYRQRRFRKIGMGILYTLFGIVALIFTLPFFLMLSNAFKTSAEIVRIPPSLIPDNPSLEQLPDRPQRRAVPALVRE